MSCSLFQEYSPFFIKQFVVSLFVSCLFVVRGVLFVVCCLFVFSLFVDCCSSCVVRCRSLVVVCCCVLFVVCCSLCVIACVVWCLVFLVYW